MRLTVAISGASGVNLALRFINSLPKEIELFLVFSKSAKKAFAMENCKKIEESLEKRENITIFKDKNIGAALASGSFKVDKMIILPCSSNTLAKCAVGIADSLITRAFTVMLKEKREIIIAPRELPLNTIMLENMLKLSKLGVTIAPPILGYYSAQQNLNDMENFIIGKYMDLLKIDMKNQNSEYNYTGSYKKAIYSGTFDPITIGHLDIIKRASNIFEEVIISVAKSELKKPMFSHEKRVEFVKAVTKNIPNVNILV